MILLIRKIKCSKRTNWLSFRRCELLLSGFCFYLHFASAGLKFAANETEINRVLSRSIGSETKCAVLIVKSRRSKFKSDRTIRLGLWWAHWQRQRRWWRHEWPKNKELIKNTHPIIAVCMPRNDQWSVIDHWSYVWAINFKFLGLTRATIDRSRFFAAIDVISSTL